MKKVVIIICFSVFVILLINSRFLIGFVEYFSYVSKANEKYISRTYNVDVTSKKQYRKTIVFYGKDNDTNEDVFIFCVYGHGIHQVYEAEGINREKALQVFKQHGNDATLDEIGMLTRGR